MFRIEIPYISTLSGRKQKTTQKTTQKIVDIMKNNPKISIKELAKRCGVTRDGINYSIRNLKNKGIIKRVGPDKGGYWEVPSDRDANGGIL